MKVNCISLMISSILNWLKLVKFILKYREKGIPSFRLITTSEYLVIYVVDKEQDIYDSLKIKYK